MAIAESKIRSHVPRVHVYPDHVFIVVHAPEIGAGGHVHYLELDQFIGEDFLITVHGPISPKVPLDAALRETVAVAARLASGRLRPTSPFGLSYAIVSSICLLDRTTRIAHGRRDCTRGRPDGAAGHD
jgi:magnesium transporter